MAGERERRPAGGRATTWPQATAARARAVWVGSPWLRRLAHAAEARLPAWAAAETAPGRLTPWLPVAFGAGIALYFTAETEPASWAAGALAAACAFIALLLRARPAGFPLALVAVAMSAGFAVATLKAVRVGHPILAAPVFGAEIEGWVEVREERERTDRITLRVHRIEARRLDTELQRVRISVRKGTAPPVGAFVALKARLSPPLAPMRPGGYDFARDLYFQGIGATGLAFGAIRRLEAPAAPTLRLTYATRLAGIRDAIDARIRAALPGDAGAIASALITGKRDAISASVNEAMYVSSLAHVLSISGYHMAIVAGVIFLVIRGGLALLPGVAVRRPIKKWAAGAALVGAFLYLLLSGAEVATQRAFLMTAVVLVGVLVDRQALTLRTLAVAAFVVMAIAPEAVVHPSFQMSFAATLALIAAYERGMPWAAAGGETSLGARIALWGGREIVALLLASVVAGLATTMYAAYHFHRVAPYGTLANLAAMPIVSAWVMPAGLFGLAALPFGFDAPFWRLMGLGIDWMMAVALWVAALPGAVGRVHGFGVGPLMLGTTGLLLVCLLRTPLRWSGVVVASLALWAAAKTPLPDILVAAGGDAVAVRRADGDLAVKRLGADSFAIRQWLAADADARTPGDPALEQGFRCDDIGCVAPLHDGRLVAVAIAPDAFADDCTRAAVIVTRRQAPPDCAALVLDRTSLQSGALALYRDGKDLTVFHARAPTASRPWTPVQSTRAGSGSGGRKPQAPAADAEPREEDVRADDSGP